MATGEVAFYKEGDNAITTHRIVWSEFGVIDFNDVEQVFVLDNDEWKTVAVFGVFSLIGFSVGAVWSIALAILFIGIAYGAWNGRKDHLFVTNKRWGIT